MFDDQIRLKAHMKSAFPSRAWVIAYLDGNEVYAVSGGAVHAYISSVAEGSNRSIHQYRRHLGLKGVCGNSIRPAVDVTGGFRSYQCSGGPACRSKS